MTRLVAGVIVLCLGIVSPILAADKPEKKVEQKAEHKTFRVGVTQVPMYTLASALAYGSPVETLLIEKNEKGNWKIPKDLTVVFWSGPALEPKLAKQLEESKQGAVAMMEAAGVHQLAKRTPAEWKKPGEDEDPHHEGLGKGYGMVQTIRPEGEIDTLYWLDPLNAMAALEAIKMVFQGLDQRNHWGYQGNADKIVQALWEMDIRVSKMLHDVTNQPFIVLQDEFQYLEQRYKLSTVPAGGSAQDIVKKAKDRSIQCVVATKSFDQNLKSALDKAGLKSAVLDPAGLQMPKSTGAYFEWYVGLIKQLNGCAAKS